MTLSVGPKGQAVKVLYMLFLPLFPSLFSSSILPRVFESGS
jgi:hypothetical protein